MLINKQIKHIATILLTVLAAATAQGHTTEGDSVQALPLVVGGTISVAEGSLGRFTAHQPHHPAENLRTSDGNNAVTTVAQFAPLAFPWIMKAAGAPTQSSWQKLAVSQTIGAVVMAGVTESCKRGIDAPRPDGEDHRAFPSGHTAWAFLGATSVMHVLGSSSPWYAFGAYTFANGVAAQRVLSNRHLPADVMASAGIGILSAELGYHIGNLIWSGRKGENSYTPTDTRNRFAISTGLLWPLGHITARQTHISRLPAFETGVRAGKSISDRWSLWAFMCLHSQPLQLRAQEREIYVGCQNSIGTMVGAQFILYTHRHLEVDLSAGGGLYGNLKPKTVDNSITTDRTSGTGRVALALTWHLSGALSCRSDLGWETATYRYHLSPSQTYGLTQRASTAGMASAIVSAISLQVDF